jgi:CO/xanthine dehydrogenase Mo-binding subunit
VRLKARRSPALKAAIEVLATIPKELAKQVRQHSKRVIAPEWKKGLAEAAPSRVHQTRLVSPSTAYVTDRNVKLIAGRNGDFVRETEFGAYREEFNTYTRKGGKVTRRTQRQFWHYTKGGHVVYPTAKNLIPRIGALWVQTAWRTVHEAFEKRGLK